MKRDVKCITIKTRRHLRGNFFPQRHARAMSEAAVYRTIRHVDFVTTSLRVGGVGGGKASTNIRRLFGNASLSPSRQSVPVAGFKGHLYIT